MKKIDTLIICCFFQLFFVFTNPVHAFDVKFGGEITDYFYKEENFFNPDIALFNDKETYNILSFLPNISFSNGNAISGYLLGDLSWLHSTESEETDDLDIDLVNAFLAFFNKRFSVQAGLQPFQFGNGFILLNDEPGIAMAFRLSRKYYMNVEAAQVLTTSKIASMTFGYEPGFLEQIEMFGVWFQDTDKKIPEFLNATPYIAASDYTIINNQGELFWLGASSNLFVGPFYFSGCLIYQTGNQRVTFEELYLQESQVTTRYFDHYFSISSGLLDLGVNYNMSSNMSVGLFLFYTPGDLDPIDSEINAFFSPMSFNLRTAIFFSGFGTLDSSDSIELVGTRWNGVLAPGINMNYQPVKSVIMEITYALLYPDETYTDDQNMYGWELDTLVSYSFRNNLKLTLEMDVFQYGDFFDSQEDDIPERATRYLIGVSGFF